MTKWKIIIVLLPLFFVACDEKSENSITVVEKNSTEFNKSIDMKVEDNKEKKLKGNKEKNLLGELGFDFKDEKIIIDLNKTSNFFRELEREMQSKAEEIEHKISSSELNISEEAMGIEVEGNQIGIDLNKTQNMLQQINVLMKDIFLDINSTNH